MDDLLKLTFEMQVALVAGYLAFSAATSGLKHGLSTEDGVFQIIVYALPATLIMQLRPETWNIYAVSAAAIAASYLVGLFWRRWLKERWFSLLRKLKLATEDNMPSTLDSVIHKQDLEWRQLSVMLQDGTKYECRSPGAYDIGSIKLPLIDKDGNVAMYADTIQRMGEDAKPLEHILNEEHGDLMTYIPASQVKRLQIRIKKH